MNTLTMQAFRGLLFVVVVMAALLFTAAGTLDYWQAWTFLSVYVASSVAITLYLMKKDPKLLERRMRGGPFAEQRPIQNIRMSVTSLGFIGLIVVPALDYRFGWSHMPPSGRVGRRSADDVGLAGDFLYSRRTALLLPPLNWRRTRKSSQPALMRWSGTRCTPAPLIMLVGIPIVLGSWWGALVVVAIMPALIWRLMDEEKFLARNLPGYREYQEKVRYRLIPAVW